MRSFHAVHRHPEKVANVAGLVRAVGERLDPDRVTMGAFLAATESPAGAGLLEASV